MSRATYGWQLAGQAAAVEPDPLPGEPLRGRIPREQDDHLQRNRQARGRGAGPRPGVRAGQRRDLHHTLRADHDVAQREGVVREGREELRVEAAGTSVSFPALAARDDLVGAVRREGRDEAVDVTAILGDGVAHPEALDLTQLRGVEPASEAPGDAVHQCSVAPVKVQLSILTAGTTTPPKSPRSVLRSQLTALVAASAPR